ncbi:MAG: hypothetical protein ABSE49_09805 [Polyangiaceae bacterium]|jgi:hypothetical protein
MRAASFLSAVTLAVVGAVASGACVTKEPQTTTYFDQTIDPIVQSSCVRTNTGAGCHVADTHGNAFGNLDTSSYAGINRRRDLLLDYGPYQQPSLLVKNVPPYQVAVQLWDGTTIDVTTDIKHTGGPILDPTASAYDTLRRWIENGATPDNTGNPPVDLPHTPCSDTIPTTLTTPSAAGFNPNADPTTSDYATFTSSVEPFITGTCAAGDCHGNLVNALVFTCGDSPQEVRWNYFAASQYLSATPQQSEILRRPLATAQGGSYHEGGPLFASVQDPNYQTILQWAQQATAPTDMGLDPAFLFFAQKVQPMLVKKGCMMAQCHSAAMFHEYRLRGGSGGSFALNTSLRNYQFSILQMSFESDDVASSRLVRKNLYRPEVFTGSNGITHRGGPLLEDFGDQLANGAVCDAANYDFDTAPVDTIPAFCVIREWHRRERAERMPPAISEVVYVSRPIPPAPDRPQDFDVFAGGASLHITQVTPTALTGALAAGGDMAVDLSGCGLGSSPDVRRPAVSWDAQTIAFAARATSGDPLAIYTMNPDGTGCAKQPDIANHAASANSILEHDFDPTFSPPGPDGKERIVFASTRGNLDSSAFDYSGPTLTPEDLTKPNANLYVLEPDPNNAGSNRVRQLTWQLNMERLPAFMQDGRMVYTVEKREPNFYELALRRQNLDGSDYHPLYSQRGSIGYQQATYVTELSHKDFAAIFSNQNAQHGAGSLGIFNRSIGVDFTSTSSSDYPVDPSVIDPSSPSSVEANFFLHSLSVAGNDGSYTSPSALPDGQLLVSYGTGDPSTFGGDYDVYVMDPVTGNKTSLLGAAGTAEVEAVGVFPRIAKGIFVATGDEPNGNTTINPADPTNADITVLDMTVLASLLFQNTPTGRLVEPDLPSFDVYEDLPPDVTSAPACPSNGNLWCDNFGSVYVRRRILGTVPLLSDGSAHFRIPGGLPMVLHLADDSESQAGSLPRWQREEMTFVPGEYAHQSFRSTFFDGLCANCHGAISGHQVDVALNPDFLTQASAVSAVSATASDFTGPPSQRGQVVGPPANP